ncbi:MAG: hypothetical protein DRP71_11415 [Verrucomicrobia bacterium]|nr:MAG: hypothetical protein DRP71_11415 [Verrucomicrobiota bacterium]
MKRTLRSRTGALCFLVAALLLPAQLSCSKRVGISDFTSDGCSLFPDHSLIDESDWCDCCLVHDIAYWKGGTEEERLAADLALRECVLARTGDEALARLMYEGVRMGGSPYFNTWYRWGYGWSFDHKYRALSEAELEMAEEKLETFFREHPAGPCR